MDIHSFLRFIYGQRGIFLSKIWTPTDKTNQIILDKTQFKFTIRTMSIERSPDNNLKLAKLDHKHRTSVAPLKKKNQLNYFRVGFKILLGVFYSPHLTDNCHFYVSWIL